MRFPNLSMVEAACSGLSLLKEAINSDNPIKNVKSVMDVTEFAITIESFVAISSSSRVLSLYLSKSRKCPIIEKGIERGVF